jgi:hypothetical protein
MHEENFRRRNCEGCEQAIEPAFGFNEQRVSVGLKALPESDMYRMAILILISVILY